MAPQALRESKKMMNLISSLSCKHEMRYLYGVYQSLESNLEKLVDLSPANSVNLKPGYDTKKSGILDKYSSELDDACLMSDASSIQHESDIRLTPSVEKYNMERLSGKTGSVSDCLDSTSIQELVCFKIDEDSSIADEMEKKEKSTGHFGRNYLSQSLAGKKLHMHAIRLYHSKETCSQYLKSQNSYVGEPMHTGISQATNNPRENHAPSIKRVGKVTQQLHGRLSKTETSCSKSEQYKSEAELEKGCILRNIVTKISSFIPHVKQKKQHPTSCVKKDVRVRALKVAEAAKRREEKKKNEREKHKAAVELERQRLKQEKGDRQKQVLIRKRQRDDDGNKKNGRKRDVVKRHQNSW